jgi:hypothetical protein
LKTITALALEVAQNMVMYLRRPGGQLQFSRYNLQQASSVGPISDLQSWILTHLNEDLSVDKLAERAAMSPRNFTRVFTRETGAPPARYVAEARLAAARIGWNKPTKRWTRLPLRPALAAVSIYGEFSNASYTLPLASIVSASTAAKWRKVILICRLRQTAGDLQ